MFLLTLRLHLLSPSLISFLAYFIPFFSTLFFSNLLSIYSPHLSFLIYLFLHSLHCSPLLSSPPKDHFLSISWGIALPASLSTSPGSCITCTQPARPRGTLNQGSQGKVVCLVWGPSLQDPRARCCSPPS